MRSYYPVFQTENNAISTELEVNYPTKVRVESLLQFGPVGYDQRHPTLAKSASGSTRSWGFSPIGRPGSFRGQGHSQSLWDKGDFLRWSRRRVDGERNTSSQDPEDTVEDLACMPPGLAAPVGPARRPWNQSLKRAHSSFVSSSRRAML
jgi:hypothetical protein